MGHQGAEERRKYPRFAAGEAEAVLVRDGAISAFDVGRNKARRAVDLSAGGTRLVAVERMEPGTRVRVKLRMERPQDEIDAAGEIRWCASAGGGPVFHVGVMFVDLDADQADRIGALAPPKPRKARARRRPPSTES
jgi:hypothetical protein